MLLEKIAQLNILYQDHSSFKKAIYLYEGFLLIDVYLLGFAYLIPNKFGRPDADYWKTE